MIRQERRRKIREAEAEIKFIQKHTPYREFQSTSEFMLPKEELDLLIAEKHEDKKLQDRFTLAKNIYLRMDYLNNTIKMLSTKKEVRQ